WTTAGWQARCMLGGSPAWGAVVTDTGGAAPPTEKAGVSPPPVDIPLPARHIVRVTSVAGARVDGGRLDAEQRREILGATGAVNVGYAVTNLSARRGKGGIVVKGRLTVGNGDAPLPVGLYSYLLQGTITDSNGNPVHGAVV